jgi:hypothetical protein
MLRSGAATLLTYAIQKLLGTTDIFAFRVINYQPLEFDHGALTIPALEIAQPQFQLGIVILFRFGKNTF